SKRPPVERALDLAPIADGSNSPAVSSGPVCRKRLYLQPVDSDHAEPLVDEVMGEGVSRRAETNDEDLAAVVRERERAFGVQGIPAGQQTVDLDSPGEREHVGENAGLDLRDVDRFLLLEDATLHAVVADPVARSRTHRVVDRDQGERADRVPL